MVILINNNDEEIVENVYVWPLGIPKEAILIQKLISNESGFSTEPKEYPVVGGKLSVKLPKTSAMILSYKAW